MLRPGPNDTLADAVGTPDVLTAELAQRAAERAAEYQRRRAETARTRAALAAARTAGLRRRHYQKLRTP